MKKFTKDGDRERVAADYEGAASLLFNRPTGKLKIPTKGRKEGLGRARAERGAEDGIDDCGGGGTFPGREMGMG